MKIYVAIYPVDGSLWGHGFTVGEAQAAADEDLAQLEPGIAKPELEVVSIEVHGSSRSTASVVELLRHRISSAVKDGWCLPIPTLDEWERQRD